VIETARRRGGEAARQGGGEGVRRASRIGEAFARCKAEGRTALIPFLTGGYPDMATVEATVPAMVAGGADLVEIGVPFSDPLAEGKTVQRTSEGALAHGTRFVDCLNLVSRLRHDHDVTVPMILMGYFNPILQYGIERAAADAAEAGVDGFIVPDLPAEESGELLDACRKHGRDLIFMVAPTSTDDRLREAGRQATGFIYCVSLTGITGSRAALSDELPAFLSRVRAATDLPLAVGFGISTREHVEAVGRFADGAACGSALINHLESVPKEQQPEAAKAFVEGLRG
jgi:tryptophan synthase alpha chain